MTDINKLFFELILVAIGNQVCLSHTPSAEEWGELYAMAKKQSLVGVCFAGVQKLQKQRQAPPEMLYLQWMGMAAKIQQRNEVVNRRCVEVQRMLNAAGFKSCILKGQGVALSYYGYLAMLRQSGDIDVWILPEDGASYDEHFRKVMAYAKTIGRIDDFNRQHVSVPFFKDTEVEVHFIPSLMNDPICNKRLQERFHDVVFRGVQTVSEGFNAPTDEFNIIYMLQHCYNHLLFEGIGLRQVMDYYFMMNEVITNKPETLNDCKKTVHDLGLEKFASALMWVLGHVFGMSMIDVPWGPNKRDGEFLLKEIMQGGNFGKYGSDRVMDSHAQGKVWYMIARQKRNLRFVMYYPREVLWAPYVMLKHFFWKRTIKY